MARFWIAGSYYIDTDEYGQLRIAGPGNHLFAGFTLPHPFFVSKTYTRKDLLRLTLTFEKKQVMIHYPVMGDIRSVRQVTELPNQQRPRFEEMHQMYPQLFMPTEISYVEKVPKMIVFTRKYGNMSYSCKLKIPKEVEVTSAEQGYKLSSSKLLSIVIECDFSFPMTKLPITRVISRSLINEYYPLMPTELQRLVKRSEDEIEHLITYAKTSSYEYGTVFPRDWMESAELGKGDLTATTIDAMYSQALAYVSDNGEGWHEDVIGELAYKYTLEGKPVVDRGMVDIEPRYMLALESGSKKFISKHQNLQTLAKVAKFIISQVEAQKYIYFKNRPVGNWRDSPGAYREVGPMVAAFDVNAVFYPQALELIRKYASLLHVEENIMDLEKVWRERYRDFVFEEKAGRLAMALCLYGEDHQPLRVAHLDEGYFFFYRNGEVDQTVAFAERLLDYECLRTDSGPLLVAKNTGYAPTQYHGEVIWPKQSAIAVGGLRRHYLRAKKEGWPAEAKDKIVEAFLVTCRASLRAFIELDGIPELYIDVAGHARAYESQRVRDGQVSYIQLWSAVGFRRMLRDLLFVSLEEEIPLRFLSE